MSLKQKIALSFFVTAFIITILMVFEYVNFLKVRNEIFRLEITDTIRSKSLQLRRHEKNFFLFGPIKAPEEVTAVHSYLKELDDIVDENLHRERSTNLSHLKALLRDYGEGFQRIESSYKNITHELETVAVSHLRSFGSLSLLDLTILEQPLQGVEFLEKEMLVPADHQLITDLGLLDAEIKALRKSGEGIINISTELDRIARENAEGVLYVSQLAVLICFPLFLIVGMGTLFFITNNVVKRLKLLTGILERTGEGDYRPLFLPQRKHSTKDELSVLIQKFNETEKRLAQREDELKIKNQELLETKKLAAIGTLASGVAHELNNPLNNIYVSAQILEKETAGELSPIVKEIVDDIVCQTLRMKRIVSDLLAFARGREPQLRKVDLNQFITGTYKLVSTSVDTSAINLTIEAEPGGVVIDADPEQMERVFINLFTNAVDAMSGKGNLTVEIAKGEKAATIRMSDTGSGMPADAVEKIFEPFYTTKEKGSGLGLAIVFNIIKKHGGEIHAESREGQGTTFTVTLPMRQGRS
ncbi:MAG: ATP-binding protein [Thermodesulfovibrionales bacterium]|jgi:signal transduction histidine kinase